MERAYAKAIELVRGYAPGLRRYGNLLLHLGRHDEAIDALERAVARKDPLAFQLLHNQAFDPLRSKPRFEALVRQLRSG